MNQYQKGIIHVTNNGELFAIIIKSEFNKEGIHFFTPNEFSQQLGYMKRPKGYKIKPHLHNKIPRQINLTQEVLFIKSGKIKVNFYTKDFHFFDSQVVNKGDILLLASGGHGFEILDEAEIIEVKQGPYSGDKDKTHFE